MSRALIVLHLSAMSALLTASEAKLQRLMIQTGGALTVTMPTDVAPRRSVYRASDGEWRPLAVQFAGGRVTFGVPADVAGQTIVLLNVPEWLVLDDDAPPTVVRITVDGEEVEVAQDIDLGHWPGAPQALTARLQDAANPIDVKGAVIALDGTAVPPDCVKWGRATGDRERLLEIRMGDMPPAKHMLSLRVPDAAAVPHYAEVSIRFNTGPLLKDGGFEEVKADGSPKHWTAHRWSVDEQTKAELRIVPGGRSGKHCAELKGIAGSLNLLFGQSVPLSPNRAYVVKGFYQATSPASYLSMINRSKGENEQYLSSPRLKPASEWTAFKWQFSTKPSSGYTLYLRNTGKGFVRYDDVVLEELRERAEP